MRGRYMLLSYGGLFMGMGHHAGNLFVEQAGAMISIITIGWMCIRLALIIHYQPRC